MSIGLGVAPELYSMGSVWNHEVFGVLGIKTLKRSQICIKSAYFGEVVELQYPQNLMITSRTPKALNAIWWHFLNP